MVLPMLVVLLQEVMLVSRDEFLARPTSPSSWREGVLAGWDMQEGREGGTWLAMDRSTSPASTPRQGRLGFLTNIFTGGVQEAGARGRGFLLTDWLRGEESAAAYLARLATSTATYSPFNLVLLEPRGAGYAAWRWGWVEVEGEGPRYTRGKAGHTPDCGPVEASQGVIGVGNHPQVPTSSLRAREDPI